VLVTGAFAPVFLFFIVAFKTILDLLCVILVELKSNRDGFRFRAVRSSLNNRHKIVVIHKKNSEFLCRFCDLPRDVGVPVEIYIKSMGVIVVYDFSTPRYRELCVRCFVYANRKGEAKCESVKFWLLV